jgi:hypothetical protein
MHAVLTHRAQHYADLLAALRDWMIYDLKNLSLSKGLSALFNGIWSEPQIETHSDDF